jgi:hypothetical protein
MDGYWSIDAPGLDAQGAGYLAEAASKLPQVIGATAVNPDRWLTRHLDAETVRAVVQGLNVAIGSGQVPEEAASCIRDVVEDFDDWLSTVGEKKRS